VRQDNPSYRLVNLKDRNDVLDRITRAEQELNQLMDGQVALIAYVKDEEKSTGANNNG